MKRRRQHTEIAVTPEMIKAGEAVLELACESGEIWPPSSYVVSAARDVYIAMALAASGVSKRHAVMVAPYAPHKGGQRSSANPESKPAGSRLWDRQVKSWKRSPDPN